MWLRARLAADLPVKVDVQTAPDRVSYLVAWYAARWRDVVAWVPTASYLGPGYAAGSWQVQWPWVLDQAQLGPAWRWAGAQVAVAQASDARARDAAQFPTLDAWLEAERTGRLAFRGAAGPRGADLVPRAARDGFVDAAWRRQNRWPKQCAACGDSFTPDRRTARRCPDCRAAGRAAQPVAAVARRTTAGAGPSAEGARGDARAAVPTPGDGALWYDVRRAWAVARDGTVRTLAFDVVVGGVVDLFMAGVLHLDVDASRQPA